MSRFKKSSLHSFLFPLLNILFPSSYSHHLIPIILFPLSYSHYLIPIILFPLSYSHHLIPIILFPLSYSHYLIPIYSFSLSYSHHLIPIISFSSSLSDKVFSSCLLENIYFYNYLNCSILRTFVSSSFLGHFSIFIVRQHYILFLCNENDAQKFVSS